MNKTESMIVTLPVGRLHPHPDNPRKDIGDVTELAESIRANGILQNLTVVPNDPSSTLSDFTVIIGHRRLAAAKLAGLDTVPCVIADMTPKEQIQTMLLENMQRSDLTVYEQAQGFQMMLDLGSTIDEISEKSGFSTTTVRRRVKMMELDQKTLKDVSCRQLSLSDFDRLSQIEDIDERNKCLEKIGTNDFNQLVTSKLRKQSIATKLPAVKKFLKDSNAKAIKSSDQYSTKYDRAGAYIYIYDADVENLAVPKEIKGTVYYYLDESYGSLQFYQEHKREKPVKKSKEQAEREKNIAEAWKQVDELNAVAYKMRSEFVQGLSVNSKNISGMLKGAVSSIIPRCIDYESANRDMLNKLLGLDSNSYDSDRGKKAMEAFDKLGDTDYPKIIYANFGDSEKRSYCNSYHNQWPEHKKCAILDALYAWLTYLGYEMSEDEKSMQNGCHEIFTRKKDGENDTQTENQT